MSPASSTAPPSLQFRCQTPRSRPRKLSAAWIDEAPDDVKASSSRYYLLDDDEQRQEAEEVKRIIKDLESQRRDRAYSTRSRRSSSASLQSSSTTRRQASHSAHPKRSGSPQKQDKAPRRNTSRNDSATSRTLPLSGNESNDDDEGSAFNAVSQSFQEQVLEELQKLKDAQRLEFEALDRLQREKDEAERRAKRLEWKLRQQQRPGGPAVVHPIDSGREIVLHEDSDDEQSNQFEEGCNGDGDATAAPGQHDTEPIDWDDAAQSPPPYFIADAIASPATSPFQRSAGWPAWSATCSPSKCSKSAPQGHRSRPHSEVQASGGSEVYRGRPRSARPPPASSQARKSLSNNRSRSPSATKASRHSSSVDEQEVRHSCAFFEDKERAQAEAEQLAAEAAARLHRAAHAAPPHQLLERQARAREKKTRQLQQLEREMRRECAREKQAKARDVPATTYLSAAAGSSVQVGEAEQQRQERIRQRSQELLQTSALPPRMAMASSSVVDKMRVAGVENGNGDQVGHMSVKLKQKLRAAAEEEAARRSRRPKPVPDFDQLHAQWDRALQKRKALARRSEREENVQQGDADKATASRKTTGEFFVGRAAQLAELRERKEARRRRLQAKEEAVREQARRQQEKLLARARASARDESGTRKRPTKAETLRVQKLLAETAARQKAREKEEREADARERKREEAARRVRAQVKRSEASRRENFLGNYVDLQSLETLAQEKAREQRTQFREAVRRNHEKLLAAAAARPSLMERFSTSVKREQHRHAALEAVVKTVFQKDLSVLKGVLTDDEQELAREMVAADDGDALDE